MVEFIIGFPLVLLLILGLIDTLRYWAVTIIAQADVNNAARMAARLSNVDIDTYEIFIRRIGSSANDPADDSALAKFSAARRLVANEATRLGLNSIIGGSGAFYSTFSEAPASALPGEPLKAALLRPFDIITRVSPSNNDATLAHPSSNDFCQSTSASTIEGHCTKRSEYTFQSVTQLYPYVVQAEINFRFFMPVFPSKRIVMTGTAFRERTWQGAIIEPFQPAIPATATALPTPPNTPTWTTPPPPTFTNTPGPSPTPTNTNTPRDTFTPTPTNTPGPSPTPTITNTPAPTLTRTPTPTETNEPIQI